MKIKKSGANYSAIVSIGEKLKKMSVETGEKYLFLNRGINAVINIDLTNIIPLIDFNSTDIQVYPPNNGRQQLRDAINTEFFQNTIDSNDLFVVGGGMSGLKLVTEVLDVKRIHISKLYWGAYTNVMKVNSVKFAHYDNFEELRTNIKDLSGSAVIICDPNNPVGNKYDDVMLLELAKLLSDNDVTVIWDSPYRRLFLDETDNLYSKLAKLKNVIIVESFSKSIGLSGQRIGFVHSTNQEFNQEFKIHLLYTANGVNAFSQVLVEKILTTDVGKIAAYNFKEKTVEDIGKNIKYLKENNFLAQKFYTDSTPVGIFVIVNRTFDELMEKKIGSVALPYFTNLPKEEAEKYSRICVSVPHEEFKSFFDQFNHNQK
jgi:aspartate/methionine/tyrosine aminotransferase